MFEEADDNQDHYFNVKMTNSLTLMPRFMKLLEKSGITGFENCVTVNPLSSMLKNSNVFSKQNSRQNSTSNSINKDFLSRSQSTSQVNFEKNVSKSTMKQVQLPSMSSSNLKKKPYLNIGYSNNAQVLRNQKNGHKKTQSYDVRLISPDKNDSNVVTHDFAVQNEETEDNLPLYREYIKKEQQKHASAKNSLKFMISKNKSRKNYSFDFYNVKKNSTQLLEKECF